MQQKKWVIDKNTNTIQEYKDKQLFDTIAEQYCKKDMNRSSILARRHRLLQTFSLLPKISEPILLEVGCGCGFAASYLKGYYSRYVGIDYSKNLISYAKKINSYDNTEFLPINIKEYKQTNCFDIIFMIGVLHHIEPLKNIVLHIIEMLKPGGWLIANEPQSANKIIQITRKVRSALDSGYSNQQHYFSSSEIFELYNSANLQNIKVAPQGIFSTPFAEVLLKPDTLSVPLAKLSITLDKKIEQGLKKYLRPISWNLIAIGQRQFKPTDL